MLKFVFDASSRSWVMGIALILAVGGAAHAKDAPPVVTKLVTLDPTVSELPESITTDDYGHVFFSLVNGQIRELLPNNSTVTIATVPVPTGGSMTGIKVGPDGLIYTTTSSFSVDQPAAFVWRTDPDTGVVEKFATLDHSGFPNDMAFEDDGSFFVTDPFLGRLYHIDGSGNATVAVSDPLLRGNPADPAFPTHDFGVDGIAWDQSKQNLYVGVIDFGRIVRIPYRCHGLGRPVVFAESPQLKGIDGIALDRSGTVYAAINTQNRIATVDQRGRVSSYAQSSLFDSPSGIAFGTARGNKKTAYISNFAIDSVLDGVTPRPAILAMPVPVPGADLD
ncbi:MAG TPA: SMP-30/gluconolactonase/LRE family protein [Polyangiaceae bacterium]|nr:SMP-30/gluconolactonase/LRE family protein [Polyangiaceae bacterium]